jgi:hypothetical protein
VSSLDARARSAHDARQGDALSGGVGDEQVFRVRGVLATIEGGEPFTVGGTTDDHLRQARRVGRRYAAGRRCAGVSPVSDVTSLERSTTLLMLRSPTLSRVERQPRRAGADLHAADHAGIARAQVGGLEADGGRGSGRRGPGEGCAWGNRRGLPVTAAISRAMPITAIEVGASSE